MQVFHQVLYSFRIIINFLLLNYVTTKQGLQPFLSEGHIGYYTTVR